MKLTIQDGRDSFYTFDSNRILLLTATDEEQIKQVEFSTEEAGGTETWTKDVLEQEDGVKYVQVPNEFLNGDYTRLVCYAVALDSKGEFTRQKEVFRIKYRPKPEDWFLTYSERITFASIKALTEQYKSNASDSAELASKYAENNEDVAVEPGKYSAKHWSIKSNKKYEEIRSYVGSASDPESALGSIESARANAVSDVEKQETDSIEAVGTYTSNTAIPSVSQYVEGTAKPALKTYGEQQVDSYVNGTSKPELDRYVNNEKKQVLDEYTAEKKTELDIYTSVDKKQVLDSYTENEKKTELDSHTVGLKEQLDAHTVAKAGDLNEHTTSLKGTLDGYTTAKEQEISEFTEQKKQEVQGVYQSDLNELKGDLDNISNNVLTESFTKPSGANYIGVFNYSFTVGHHYEFKVVNTSGSMNVSTWDGSSPIETIGTNIGNGVLVEFVPTKEAQYFRIVSNSSSTIMLTDTTSLINLKGQIDDVSKRINKSYELMKNIYNYEENENGIFVNNGGIRTTVPDYFASAFIDVSEFKNIFLSGGAWENNSVYVSYYNKSKNAISGGQTITAIYVEKYGKQMLGGSLTIPDDAKYCVLSANKRYAKRIILCDATSYTDYEPYQYKFEKKLYNVNEMDIPIEIHVSADGSKDFSTLFDAFQYITSLGGYEKRDVSIYLHEGTYNPLNEIPNLSDYPRGLTLPENTKLIGYGKKENIVVQIDGIGHTTSEKQAFSAMNIASGGTIKNITFIGLNCRYTIHQDFGTGNDEILLENVVMKYLGHDMGSNWGGGVYGAGCHSNERITLRNCEMYASQKNTQIESAIFGMHSNLNFEQKATIRLENCKMFAEEPNKWIISFRSLASRVENDVVVDGCTTNCPIVLRVTNNAPFDFNIVGHGNNAIAVKDETVGNAFARFNDETISLLNRTNATITKGTAVKRVSIGECEPISNSSEFYGIALEDIESGNIGIIKNKGFIKTSIVQSSNPSEFGKLIGDYILMDN